MCSILFLFLIRTVDVREIFFSKIIIQAWGACRQLGSGLRRISEMEKVRSSVSRLHIHNTKKRPFGQSWNLRLIKIQNAWMRKIRVQKISSCWKVIHNLYHLCITYPQSIYTGVFLLKTKSNARQWRKSSQKIRRLDYYWENSCVCFAYPQAVEAQFHLCFRNKFCSSQHFYP